MTSEIYTEEAIKKPNSFFRIIKLFFWIIILILIYIYYSYSSFQSKIIVQNNLILEIKS